jgi:ribonuclease D
LITTLLLKYFPKAKVLGFDIEATGLNFWQDTPTAVSLSNGTTAVVIDLRGLKREAVSHWLKEHVFDREIVVHNGQYDFTFLHQYYDCGYPANYHDTQLAEKLLMAGASPEIRYTLQAVALRRLSVQLNKDLDLRTGFQLENVWTSEQIEYAANDAKVLLRIAALQKAEIAAKGLSAIWANRDSLPAHFL